MIFLFNFIKNKLNHKIAGVFLFYSVIFFIFHLFKKGFFCVDPYYHAKHSLLISQTGNLTLVEPWLNFHFLNFAPNDPWWAHHLITAFVMKFLDPIISLKLVSALFVGAVLAVFYFILTRFQIKKPFVWTFLYFSSSFLFLSRLILERPHLFAIAFMPLIFYLGFKKRYYSLFLLSFLYALFYNLIFYPVFVVLLACAIDYIVDKKPDLKPAIAVGLGILAGVFAHPDTMNYMYVATIHSFGVIFYKFSGVELGIGGEVKPLLFKDLLKHNFLAICAYLISIAVFLNNREFFSKIKINLLWQTLAISAFWFVIMLLVPRGAEYWMPFAWIFIAVCLSGFTVGPDYAAMKNAIGKKLNLRIMSFFAYGILAIIMILNFSTVYNHLRIMNKNNPDESFKEANEWLVANSEKGETVFFTNWSFWPRMFFYNDHNRYVHGMDPTFLYEYDKDLAALWLGISYEGRACYFPCKDEDELEYANAADLIKHAFKSRYIIIGRVKEEKALNLFSNEELFVLRFQNTDLAVYEAR
jgi:hypothetical protein